LGALCSPFFSRGSWSGIASASLPGLVLRSSCVTPRRTAPSAEEFFERFADAVAIEVERTIGLGQSTQHEVADHRGTPEEIRLEAQEQVPSSLGLADALHRFRKEYARRALELCSYRGKVAAARLGIGYSTLKALVARQQRSPCSVHVRFEKLAVALEHFEEARIAAALKRAGNDKRRAALDLGIGFSTLKGKLAQRETAGP